MKKIFELVLFIKDLPNLRVYYMHDPIDTDALNIIEDMTKITRVGVISKSDNFYESSMYKE